MTYEKLNYLLDINSDNELEEQKLFIESLEDNLKKFISSTSNENNNFIKQNKINKNKVQYTPEKLIYSSPITILEGLESSGKTSFIESICKRLSNNEIQLSYINKVKIINLLSYIPHYEGGVFANLFINDLLDILDKNSNAKKKLNNYLSNFLAKSSSNNTNFNLNLINDLNKGINKPILFIIDNIEKININFEILLRVINKLSIVKNFSFLFIVDRSHNNAGAYYQNTNNELISKNYKELKSFVNLPIYKFKQDYTCVLKKYDLSFDMIFSLNYLFTSLAKSSMTQKDLDIFLTSNMGNNNHLNKYKLLVSLMKLLPEQRDYINNVISRNIESFLKNLEEIYELKRYYFTLSKEQTQRYSSLNSYKEDDYKYWNNSDIKNRLQDIFNKIIYIESDNWLSYYKKFTEVYKIVNESISNIEKEISTIEKQKSNVKVLKANRSCNDEKLFSITNVRVSDANFEISSPKSLNDKLINCVVEEINKIDSKVAELKSILTNLKNIQVNLKNYFDNIENNKKILPDHLNKMLKNINFADEISLLNKILNSKSPKSLWNSDSYKNIQKIESIKDIINNDNLECFDELLNLINNELRNYIIDNYDNLD